MKRSVIMMAVIGLLLSGGSGGVQASIRDNPNYVPSTGLHLGNLGQEWGGRAGWVIADPFQINLEYQPGILNSSIDALNSYDPDGTWDYNYSDNAEYVFSIDVNGNLPALTYPSSATTETFQWTLTGWHQSIFAGSIVDEGGVLFFKIDPTQGYRSFPNDPPVNDVEVFSGIVLTEVVGYTFNGSIAELEPGSLLEVRMIPEPATIIVWSLLGLTVVGYGAWRRRRRAA